MNVRLAERSPPPESPTPAVNVRVFGGGVNPRAACLPLNVVQSAAVRCPATDPVAAGIETVSTERYSGAFTNRTALNELLIAAGRECGERVWPFPMDEDYDELLKSDVADVKQCSTENAGDHILGARFLSRFVPKAIPWVHMDLSAGQHKGGLAHIPTDITGFGVRLTIELLQRCTDGPDDLAKRLSA